MNRNLNNWLPSFIDTFSPILSAVRFTSLSISCCSTASSTLFKIIQLLPNLDSLRIESFPAWQLADLSDEDTERFRLISTTNKIKKVWQSMELKLTEFLLALCPQMEHMEVNWITNTDIERLVRFILTKTTTHIPHLHSLRLSVLQPNDEMIQTLQNITNSEKLLSNYLIKRSGENIYLQWKL